MYLWNDGNGLREEGRYIFDGYTDGWRVVPMLDKKDASSPLLCSFPSGLLYNIANDSGVTPKPSIPDLQFFAGSRKAGRNASVSITEGRGITSSSNALWGEVYMQDDAEWAGLNYLVGVNGCIGDLLVQQTRNDKKISISHTTTTGGKIESDFSPPINYLSCHRIQGSSPPIVKRRKYCYSFAMAVNFSKNMVMSNFAQIQFVLPFERGEDHAVRTVTNLRELVGSPGADGSFEFKRFVSTGSTGDDEFYVDVKPTYCISGDDILYESYIVRGYIYLNNGNSCALTGEAAFYLPWLRFKPSELVFRRGQTTGTISINYAECVEGWMDIGE